MLIHHEDYLPDCEEYINSELAPRILDAPDFDAAFIEAMAMTEGADNPAGDYMCSSCLGLAMVGDQSWLSDDDRGDDWEKC